MESLLVEVGFDLHVPALADVEVLSVLRRALRLRRMTRTRFAEAVEDYLDLPLSRHRHLELIPVIVSLSDNFSAYDAAYAALAHRLGSPLLTADRRLATAAQRHLRIEVRQV